MRVRRLATAGLLRGGLSSAVEQRGVGGCRFADGLWRMALGAVCVGVAQRGLLWMGWRVAAHRRQGGFFVAGGVGLGLAGGSGGGGG